MPNWGSEIRRQEKGDDRIQKERTKDFNFLKSRSWEKPSDPQAGQFILIIINGIWKELMTSFPHRNVCHEKHFIFSEGRGCCAFCQDITLIDEAVVLCYA